MTLYLRKAVLAVASIASIGCASAALAEAKPVYVPPKFDYTLIPVKGCVLRPTSNPAQAEMGCTPDAKTIAQCSETNGELGSINGQLMCRKPRAAMGPAGRPGTTVKSPYEPPFGPDAAVEATWQPVNIKGRVR